ncbi:MAG TPA: pyridoxamine 5'-phosphate oxidase family protein [Acidimicrobiales bacterium]|nr:pyridoxamine 5'-phosphate oxidase family protein [Acidimicrobiales bacterium]
MALGLDHALGRGFDILDEEECLSLLSEESLGRVAVSVGAIPAVFPVNYHCEGGAIYFRTGQGTKLAAALRSAVVAFEIDRADAQSHQGWSVLAVGVAREVREEAVRQSVEAQLQPWAPGERSHLIRIWPDFVSGRRIGSGDSIGERLSS